MRARGWSGKMRGGPRRGSGSFGAGDLLGLDRLADVAGDAVDVVHGLAEWRHPVVLLDVAFARVVAGDGEVRIVFEFVEKPAQVLGSGVNVLFRIERVADAEALRGGGHELHQAARA